MCPPHSIVKTTGKMFHKPENHSWIPRTQLCIRVHYSEESQHNTSYFFCWVLNSLIKLNDTFYALCHSFGLLYMLEIRYKILTIKNSLHELSSRVIKCLEKKLSDTVCFLKHLVFPSAFTNIFFKNKYWKYSLIINIFLRSLKLIFQVG